jgi:hypothetical protein
MTDIDERIAARLVGAASEGARQVREVDLGTVLGLGSRRARRRRIARRVGLAVALVVIAVVAFTVPLPRLVLHTGTGRPSVPGPAGDMPVVGTVPVADVEAGGWGVLPPAPIASRAGVAEVWTGSELLIWGGTSGPHGTDLEADGAAYDPATGRWRLLPPAPLAPRTGIAAVWTGSEMVVFGGDTGSGPTDDAAAYAPATNTWQRLPPAPLSPRAGSLAVWTGSSVVVLGGHGASGTPYADGASYDPATRAWTYIPPAPAPDEFREDFAPGSPVDFVAALVSGHEVLGLSEASDPKSEVIHVYGLSSGTWRLVRSSPAVKSALWTGSDFMLGLPRGVFPSSELWDPVSGSFAVPGTPSWGLGQVEVSIGNALLSLDAGRPGGTALYQPPPSIAEAERVPLGTWVPLPTAPFGCDAGNPPVWTGGQLLVYCPQGARASGLVYSPRAPATQPSCFGSTTTLRVTDAESGHGMWPLVGLYQLVALVPGESFQHFTPDGRAVVFEAAGAGWKLVGYLPTPADGSAPAAGQAVIQFSGSYTPGQRYLVEIAFIGHWVGPIEQPLIASTDAYGTSVDLCATVVISGGTPAVTTTIAS